MVFPLILGLLFWAVAIVVFLSYLPHLLFVLSPYLLVVILIAAVGLLFFMLAWAGSSLCALASHLSRQNRAQRKADAAAQAAALWEHASPDCR